MTVYPFAGFWRRFAAYMIDGFILSIILTILAIISVIAYFAGALSANKNALLAGLMNLDQLSWVTLWIWLGSTILNIVYFTYFYATSGRSPGKMIMGLQVVTSEGGPLSFGVAFLRSVGYLVSSLFFGLGFIWVGFDKKKQGWHDKIASTVVIIRQADKDTLGISIPEASDPTLTRQCATDPNGPGESAEKTGGCPS
jgi:uncharacterized RDD family membrane protein YckC